MQDCGLHGKLHDVDFAPTTGITNPSGCPSFEAVPSLILGLEFFLRR
jgi:hypothetical protein